MYLRRDTQTLKDGTRRCYVSLAHNVREPGSDGGTRSKPIVFVKLGPEDALDKKMLMGMRDVLSKLIEEKFGEESPTGSQLQETAAQTQASSAGLRILCSRQFGLPVIVEKVWNDLGLGDALRKVEGQEASRYAFERVVFAMVLNRLVDPASKRACNEWIAKDAYFPEAVDFGVQHFYRALDVLERHSDEVLDLIGRAARASCSIEDLSLLLMDTTSTYYESDLSDAERQAVAQEWQEHFEEGAPRPSMPYPQVVNDPPMRMRGHSKDSRPSQPQVKIGLVSTADGRIVHVETMAGNTSDQSPGVDLLVTARARLGTVGRLVAVMDSGMGGGPNLARLDALEEPFDRVSAVPLRNSKFADERLLSKAGRWAKHPFKAGFTIRSIEVSAADGKVERAELWVATRNEAEAGRQRRLLDKEVRRVQEALADDPCIDGHGRPVCALLANGKRRKLIKKNARGDRFILDRDRIRVEKRRAGVHVIRSTLTDLGVEATLRAYQAQYAVEDQFRTFKGPLKLRPMHHRATRRIQAHVLVCSLALMVLRELERRTGATFADIKKVFGRVHATQLQQGHTTFWQREEWTPEAAAMLAAIGTDQGPRTWGGARNDS